MSFSSRQCLDQFLVSALLFVAMSSPGVWEQHYSSQLIAACGIEEGGKAKSLETIKDLQQQQP